MLHNVHIYSLDHSPYFMLAVGVPRPGVISHRLASDAPVPHYWSHHEWDFCFPLSVDYAACENSTWSRGKMKKKYSPDGHHDRTVAAFLSCFI